MLRQWLLSALPAMLILPPPANIPDVLPVTNNIQQVYADEDDGSVVINGFKCYLNETEGTFSIAQIMSLSSEDLVVPYTVTYEGKEYHCDEINLTYLRGNIRDQEDIIPDVKSVTFSEGIKTLKGYFPLNRCKKVTIPSTVESIEYAAFNYGVSAGYSNMDEEWALWQDKYNANFTCFDLEEFVVDKDNKHFTAKDGLLYTKDMKMLMSCPRNKNGVVEIPEGVETLANGSFCLCNRVTEIKLPSTLKNIGYGYGRYPGFYYCLNLEKINIPEGVETVYGGSFRYCVKLKSLTLPTTLINIDVNYHESADRIEQLNIFGPLPSLTELNWEDSGIESIDVPNDYTKLFAAPVPTQNLRLPKHVKTICSNAFYGVNPPAVLHLPATIESLGEKGSSDKVRGIPTQIYQRYMIDFP